MSFSSTRSRISSRSSISARKAVSDGSQTSTWERIRPVPWATSQRIASRARLLTSSWVRNGFRSAHVRMPSIRVPLSLWRGWPTVRTASMWTCGSTSGGDTSRPSASSSGRSSDAMEPGGRIAAIRSPSTDTSTGSTGRPNVGWTRALRTISPVVATCSSGSGTPAQCAAHHNAASRKSRRGKTPERYIRGALPGLDPAHITRREPPRPRRPEGDRRWSVVRPCSSPRSSSPSVRPDRPWLRIHRPLARCPSTQHSRSSWRRARHDSSSSSRLARTSGARPRSRSMASGSASSSPVSRHRPRRPRQRPCRSPREPRARTRRATGSGMPCS